MLFFNICWMEKYKKNQYLTVLSKFCFVSYLAFTMRRSKKENFLPLISTRWLETPNKASDVSYDEILEACPLHVLPEVCGGQVEKQFHSFETFCVGRQTCSHNERILPIFTSS